MAFLVITGGTTITGCSESFLKPDPLSFYEPTTTFSSESGLQAALAQADRNLKLFFTNNRDAMRPLNDEFVFSDMCVVAASDKQAQISDIAKDLIPSSSVLNDENDATHNHSIMFFWNQGYAGIKYANTVIGYAGKVTSLDEPTRNIYIGRAYFHRAFRYYTLVNQFGNVPLITKLLEVPKQNYRSTKREAILQMIEGDMQKAVRWVPDQAPGAYTATYPGGYVNKGACRMLLAKIYMENGKFTEAVSQLDTIISKSGYALMTEPFGTEVQPAANQTWHVERNIIWDLHRGENVYNAANTELIMGMPNQGDNLCYYTPMRNIAPFIFNNSVTSPSGKQALQNYNRKHKDYNSSYDYQRVFGRGVANSRPSAWAQYGLWSIKGVADSGDLRHSSKVGNWLRMTDLKYNNADDKDWFGKNLRMYADDGTLLVKDSIRRWYDIPLYKLYYLDAVQEQNLSSDGFRGVQKGSVGDMYLYRLAEAYLLRAEAKFYLNPADPTIADDLNIIRRRAHCQQLYTPGKVTIGDIFDERARELYLEEWRHVELVRASYDLAISGRPDEWGNTYKLTEIGHESGTEKTGGSYWYQRCVRYNFYNDGITRNVIATGQPHIKYTIDKHNMFWPIPEKAITANTKGMLIQNYGYPGYDASVETWDNWQDAVADEDKTE